MKPDDLNKAIEEIDALFERDPETNSFEILTLMQEQDLDVQTAYRRLQSGTPEEPTFVEHMKEVMSGKSQREPLAFSGEPAGSTHAAGKQTNSNLAASIGDFLNQKAEDRGSA